MALPAQTARGSTVLPERWDPFRELDELQSRMGQLMENVWSGAGSLGNGIWSPPVDIEETDDAWIVEADLPGVKHADVNVDVRDSELVVSGDIKERERKGILRRRTRRTGRFELRVTFPGQVNADKVKAKVGDGVLTVRIPKAEQEGSRRIEVKSEA
jgi:HSP20 family protein